MMTEEGAPASEARKIYWRSRRGMRELDLLLVPFALQAYAGLSPADQSQYRQLLECEDQDLYAWLMRREPAAARQAIIDRILAHNAAQAEQVD